MAVLFRSRTDGDDEWPYSTVKPSDDEDSSSPERTPATRALSVTAVENDFVEGVYDKLAKVYDLIFGPTLHPGRLQAIQRMDITAGRPRARGRRRHRHQSLALSRRLRR